jgi:hypothetical protein
LDIIVKKNILRRFIIKVFYLVSDRESAAPTKKEEKPNPYFSHELQNYNRRFDNHIPFASPRYPKNILVSGQNNWYERSNPGNKYSLSDCSQLALKGIM